MSGPKAVPFVLKRNHGTVVSEDVTQTVDTLHGILRIVDAHILVQWRSSRTTSVVGSEIRTDREVMSMQQVQIPLAAIASARVKLPWPRIFRAPLLQIIAADLSAFQLLQSDNGIPGLVFEHPAELLLTIRRSDRQLAEEFCTELELANADRLLAEAEESYQHSRLPPEG